MFAPLSTVGIGSLPFIKGENSCEKVFERWDIPFWPQYPSRSRRENLVFQFLSGFPGLTVRDDRAVFSEAEFLKGRKPYQKRIERAFLEKSFLSFEAPVDWALGYAELKEILAKGLHPEKRVVKLQITGPETVWKSFFSHQVSRSLETAVREDLTWALRAAGLAQIQRVQSMGRQPLILIDDPLPSENSPGLVRMLDDFKSFGARVGLHVCSASFWNVCDPSKIDLIHFDTTQAREPDRGRVHFLKILLGKGGWVVWGIVPTSPDSDFQVRDFSPLLLSRVRELSEMGWEEEKVLRQSLLAPACGTGGLSPSQDEAVFRSLQQTLRGLCLVPNLNKKYLTL